MYDYHLDDLYIMPTCKKFTFSEYRSEAHNKKMQEEGKRC